ncbi:MAG TPA: hypothetical protein VIK81_04295 [Patescibacteria group bacterium]
MKLYQKILISIFTFLPAMVMVGATVAIAQINIDITSGTQNVLPRTTIPNIITAAIRLLIVAAFTIAFIFLIFGGIKWITAGGDKNGVESARNMVTAALVGLVIVLASFAIIRLVESFFGLRIITTGQTIQPVAPE